MSTYVYFIQAMGTDLLKIGMAVNPSKRLAELQTASPHSLILNAIVPFNTRLEAVCYERRLHGLFKSLHIRGEWFRSSEELRSLISKKAFTHRAVLVAFCTDRSVASALGRAKGGHTLWHVRRGIINPKCELCRKEEAVA